MVLAAQMACSVLPVYADTNTAVISEDASNKPMSDGNKLRMWYTTPGSRSNWESTALVIGNGKTGGILLGQVGKDQIHFNEKTLWNGGPSDSRPNYDGGNRDTAVTEEQLNAVREKMDDHSTSVFPMGTSIVSEVWGDGDGMGSYQDFGDLYLDFAQTGATNENVENYVRDLDMTTGISSVNYDYEQVHYEREYFASHPDHVVVTRLTASQTGKISFTASVSAASGLTVSTRAEAGKIILSGTVNDNQMKCEMQVKILPEGGTLTNNADGTITVVGADTATIIYATDTDYKNSYPTYRTNESAEELSASIAAVVDQAAALSYKELKDAHVEDYSELFDRVSIDLGGTCAEKSTDLMMADYRNGETDPVIEEMIYQFGRYLTIAASREGDELPSNLCGIWMIGSASSYWGGDFHFNVNVQMNYWPAYQTNLAECGSVFTDYVESLVQPGRVTAERSAAQKTEDVVNTPIGEGNGFLVNTQNNPFGCTAPFGSQEYGWNITGSSWALQNVYDQYLYTQDKTLLEEQIYPMLKEMTNFWDGFLWWSDYQNRLVVGPSFSAEQGPTVNGSTYDQSLVWELYEMAIEASEILGVDEEEREQWEETQEKLNPIIIGDEGQVKEWYEETTTGKAQAGLLSEVSIPNFGAGGSANQGSLHRHTSQLIGLYPGTLINKDNEEWMEAAKKTLEIRNLGGTGWSKAHKINMWARTGDGETTYELIRAMIAGNTNGILDNFLDSHPPFQIDGNYGLTAGMTEALLQSQLGYTQFLPAVSEEWSEGNVQGIVARGNFVIGMEWSQNAADRFTVTARSGGNFTGEYENISSFTVKKSDGTSVEVTKLSDDKISFETDPGETYTIDRDGLKKPYKVQFSKGSGQVAEGTEIMLTASEEDLVIRYTTDGNDPMGFSDIYDGPIAITGKSMTIKAAIFKGGKRVSDIVTRTYTTGSDEPVNVSPTATQVSGSNVYENMSDYNAEKAIDGNDQTRWATNDNTTSAVLELTFAEAVKVDSASLSQFYYPGKNDISDFNIEYWNGEEWITAYEHGSMNSQGSKDFTFEQVITADKIRLNIITAQNPSIYEFKLYQAKVAEQEADKSQLQSQIDRAKAYVDQGKVDQAGTLVQETFTELYQYALSVKENQKSSRITIDRTCQALEKEIQKLERVLEKSGIAFVDVKKDSYYEAPVLWAVKNDITYGRTATEFRPKEDCTRAQVVTFLWRTAGSPEPVNTDSPFKDVGSSLYKDYYKAILWAKETGITDGYKDGTFRPDDVVTRAEFVTFLYRANDCPSVGITENPFVDVNSIHHGSFTKAILWAYENRITLGKDNTHFEPDTNCSRANIVTFLYRNMA